MTVNRIEPFHKRTSRVFFEEVPALVLYQGEIQRYHLAEGSTLDQKSYEELYRVVGARAREKAFSLLELQARTEAELRNKLKQAGVPEPILDEIVCFLTEYGYLDDEAYVKNYLEIHGKRKSRAELKRDLLKKGLDRELILKHCQAQESESREIIAAILKKRGCTVETPWKERQKTMAYLMRRGFSWEEIREGAAFLEAE